MDKTTSKAEKILMGLVDDFFIKIFFFCCFFRRSDRLQLVIVFICSYSRANLVGSEADRGRFTLAEV